MESSSLARNIELQQQIINSSNISLLIRGKGDAVRTWKVLPRVVVVAFKVEAFWLRILTNERSFFVAPFHFDF